MGLVECLVFSIGYNLRWQRLLYILGLMAFVHVVSDGFRFPQPWWHIFGFYGLSWMAVVAADTVMRRFTKRWPD